MRRCSRAARVQSPAALGASARAPPAPWQRVRGDGRFALWEQPEVSPIAAGSTRAWRVWDGDERAEAAAAADALRAEHADRGAAGRAVARDAAVRAARRPRSTIAAHRRPSAWRLELDAGDAPALVFLSEGYHPWWRAEVDGEPAPVWRASIAHLAVPVAPGRHAVELRLVRPA